MESLENKFETIHKVFNREGPRSRYKKECRLSERKLRWHWGGVILGHWSMRGGKASDLSEPVDSGDSVADVKKLPDPGQWLSFARG